MPFSTLQKTDAKRNLQVIKPCEVALVAGNHMPSLINLKYDFIDNACQSIETARVAVAAPIEQSGNAELAAGGQSTPQVLEKFGRGRHARDHEPIAGAGAGYIEQMPIRVSDHCGIPTGKHNHLDPTGLD